MEESKENNENYTQKHERDRAKDEEKCGESLWRKNMTEDKESEDTDRRRSACGLSMYMRERERRRARESRLEWGDK